MLTGNDLNNLLKDPAVKSMPPIVVQYKTLSDAECHEHINLKVFIKAPEGW